MSFVEIGPVAFVLHFVKTVFTCFPYFFTYLGKIRRMRSAYSNAEHYELCTNLSREGPTFLAGVH